jgi:hypothetical protein
MTDAVPYSDATVKTIIICFLLLVMVVTVAAVHFVSRRQEVQEPQGLAFRRPRQQADSAREASLRQNLRLKVGYDEVKIDSLIEL